MVSPWSIPMPLEDYTKSLVVVYFYSDRWIPITGFSLVEAIRLYNKALRLGKEILVFPPDVVEDGDPSLDERQLVTDVNHCKN